MKNNILIQNEDVNSSFSVFKRKKSTALLGQKRGEQGSENYSVVGTDLSGTSPWRARPLVRSGPGAAPAAAKAAAGVLTASTGGGLTASSSPSTTSVDSWPAHGTSVRHEPSPVEGFS